MSALDYDAETEKLMAARPLIGSHRVGRLVVRVTHTSWSVQDEQGRYFSDGRAKTADGLRAAIAKAIKAYARTNRFTR